VRGVKILEALKEVMDPEIPLDILNLGLIYGVQVKGKTPYIDMTFTVPSCPAKNYFAEHIRELILNKFPELEKVVINYVFEPPWNSSMINDEGKEKLRSIRWEL
jgi:metal-sulfur cluster biosynthetic enzyme